MLRPSLAVVLAGFVLKTSEGVKNWLQARATEPLLTGLVVESTLVMSWFYRPAARLAVSVLPAVFEAA